MSETYYNSACVNKVMRQNGKPCDVSAIDAAEECNRLLALNTALEAQLAEQGSELARTKLTYQTQKKQLAEIAELQRYDVVVSQNADFVEPEDDGEYFRAFDVLAIIHREKSDG